jgi:hypothetical protein
MKKILCHQLRPIVKVRAIPTRASGKGYTLGPVHDILVVKNPIAHYVYLC